MSESINLHLNAQHLRKLQNGKNFQMTGGMLKSAIDNAEPNVELHMAKTHLNAIKRAHKNGKGYRFQHKHIHGGSLNLRNIGRTLKRGFNKAVDFGKQALKNPIVKQTAKELGHIALSTANNYANQRGYDTGAYTALAHQALEGKNVNNAVQQQLSNDIINKASEAMLGQGLKGKRGRKKGGKINFRGIGNAIIGGIKKVASNPIAQQVATNVASDAIATAMMGAGIRRRFAKGSAEAKAHMAKIRQMRKKGGALLPA